MKCEICGCESGCLGNHVKVHRISVQDYYDKYLKQSEDEGFCKNCGKPTQFRNLSRGYDSFCSKSCGTQYKWKTDESYRSTMIEKARETMTKNNQDWLTNPDYENWRQEVNKGRSERMTQWNKERWQQPEWREFWIDACRARMCNAEFKSNMDKAAFLRFREEYPNAILYIIVKSDCFKIGVCISDPIDKTKHFLDYKLRKYPSKLYYLFYGDINTIAEIEFRIKTEFEPISGYREWYNLSTLNLILDYVNKTELIKL